MKLIAIAIIVTLTGCAQPFRAYAHWQNSQDPCQRAPQPQWCGASQHRTVIYVTPRGEPLGAPVGYTKTR